MYLFTKILQRECCGHACEDGRFGAKKREMEVLLLLQIRCSCLLTVKLKLEILFSSRLSWVARWLPYHTVSPLEPL